MANIAENKFYLEVDEDFDITPIREKIEKVFEDNLEGEITWADDSFIEGYFESRWDFPMEIWDEILEEQPIYFRCLTEEYGVGLVSMNIHDKDGYWRDTQYFEL